jgi:hypothetical protein
MAPCAEALLFCLARRHIQTKLFRIFSVDFGMTQVLIAQVEIRQNGNETVF